MSEQPSSKEQLRPVDISRERVTRLVQMDAVPTYVVTALLDEIDSLRANVADREQKLADCSVEIFNLESDKKRLGHEPAPVQVGTHPMLDVMLICDAYESGMGQGLKNKPMGEYRNPYDPVNDPHTYRAYGLGYDEGTKRSTGQPPEKALHDFKNFHRLLCERFNCVHDEVDWQRDQLSLIEWIAEQMKQSAPSPEPIPGADQIVYAKCVASSDDYEVTIGFVNLKDAQDFHQWLCMRSAPTKGAST